MKKGYKIGIYIGCVFVLYMINVYFAMYRSWVPVPSNSMIPQTELEYFIQELSNGNTKAYILLALDMIAIVWPFYFAFMNWRKNKTS